MSASITMCENFILHLFETIGGEPLASDLRELYITRKSGQDITEELII